MFISTTDLEKIYKDDSVLIIDARSYKDYTQGHIHGAVSLDLFSFHWADTSQKGLMSFGEHMRKILSYAGVDENKKLSFMMMLLECLQLEVFGCVYISHIQMFKC
uniref:Rhodanese domain-containing protein (TST, MPST, sseA) n=1 Tax=uncultured marine thaumarchaeote AD1000_54_F06 TaxID=1455925 RepID=A0A075FTF0_9ARCH|nr:rhodanese domain-containing protein (TST, MPST, sseA) [uncultured marine thaumarchaeote AD1000_54_F06]